MEINEPTFQIRFAGDVKRKVIEDPHAHIVTYEAAQRETVLFIKTTRFSPAKTKQMGRKAKQHFSQYGRILSVRYYRLGADIIPQVSQN